MKAIVLSVGDELVRGQTVDTNSAWISQQLLANGCDVAEHRTVGDDQSGIERAIADAAPRCDSIIITGGLGPTDDDLTRQAIAAVLGVELELRQDWLDRIAAYFARINRPMAERNKIQAMLPRGCDLLDNPVGTACGIACRVPPADCRLFSLPGVPREMKQMFADHVLPWIKQRSGGSVILQKTLHTFGLGESNIAERLGDLMRRDRNPSVGTTVSNNIVSLRINARFDTRDEAERDMQQTIAACHEKLGELIFGQDDESLSHVVAGLLTQSATGDRGSSVLTVTTAESCTGGLLAKMLTDIPGSSDYFKTGFITYSNQSKRDRLGVSENLINVHGAVSEPVVLAMAKGARRLAAADYALAISGVAGPGGGTEAKPVGTVCIALAHLPPSDTPRPQRDREDEVTAVARTFKFTGDRQAIRDRAAKMALTMLRFRLLGKPMPF